MKYIDSSLLDKAILFAANAHKNTERRGKGYPYIAHPLEAMSIVATMTNDQELLAAACLHDVIEDTDITYEQIKKEFGERIADLVKAESDEEFPDLDPKDSWKIRKQIAMDRLAHASRDVQMVAMGDKLSNMRAMYRDYKKVGEELWQLFHVTDPSLHEWHYRGLASALRNLEDTEPYKEFVHLINKTFSRKYGDFTYDLNGFEVFFHGLIDKDAIKKVESDLSISHNYVFDFKDVYNINFSGLRGLLNLKEAGYHFYIRNASRKVANRIETSAVSTEIITLHAPKEYSLDKMKQSGDGYTAVTYFTDDGDAMIKLYYEFVDLGEIEKEKRYASLAMSLGIPTPIVGDLVDVDGKIGIIFERIKDKISFASMMAKDPTKTDELAREFAMMSKKLHNTEVNTSILPNRKNEALKHLESFKDLSDKEKECVKNFILGIPDTNLCLHGDYHIGNAIITKDNEKLFIDMGDLSYGHPYIDLGTLYFVCHDAPEETAVRLFHNDHEAMYNFFKCFVKYYFDGKKSLEEIEDILRPYSALTVLLFAYKSRQAPWMADHIKYLLKDYMK